MPACSECGKKATCEYDFGTGRRLACAGHDPFRWPWLTIASSTAYWYRSIPDLTTVSVSHLPWQAMMSTVMPPGYIQAGHIDIMTGGCVLPSGQMAATAP